jgi:3-oxoacyl-[acyl-carrier-protein] synthase-3
MRATVPGVRLAGIASAVPAQSVSAIQTGAALGMSDEESLKVANMTGVKQRRVAPTGLCTSDMALEASSVLFDQLGWERSSIDILVVVSQTLDYQLPATACVLQERIGLSDHCAAFDVSLGCSGYVYGLWLASSLLSAGSGKRALLVAGETGSKLCSPLDRSTSFLFGDAGTATLLERDDQANPMHFVLGTDGSGKGHLIVPGGGARNPVIEGSLERIPGEDGYLRNQLDLSMNGAEVFSFTLQRVPQLFKDTLQLAGWDLSDVDAVVPHQANLFMLKHLAKSMKIPLDKILLSLEDFGNTSSASIPLTVSYRLASKLNTAPMNLLMAGFGVGWSWGAVALTCGPMAVPPIVEIAAEETVGAS